MESSTHLCLTLSCNHLCNFRLTLESIYLEENNISSFESLLENSFPKLYEIRARMNNIASLGLTCDLRKKFWPALTDLHVESNRLKNLPGIFCPEHTANGWLPLSVRAKNNPFVCDNSLNWMVPSIHKLELICPLD